MPSEKHDQDPTSKTGQDVCDAAVPPGMDRRTFMMRSAVVSAAAVIAGCSTPSPEQIAQTPAPAPAVPASSVSPDLDVVKRAKGPVMTTLEEFYKVGPGPSSSHTIGPMRITYDFYQRATKLPADQLAKATAIRVHLYGSLSATGKGHGTERAALAGIVGKEPATVEPAFLDSLAEKPDQTFPVKLGDKTLTASLEGHRLRRAERRLSASQHDDLQADGRRHGAARAGVLLGRRRLHRVEGLHSRPRRGSRSIPYSTMKELQSHARAQQAVDRAGRDGERGGGLGQERGRDQRVPRQDLDRDGQHRQDRAERARSDAAGTDQAEDQGGRRLQARDGRSVRGAERRRRRVGVRPGGLGGECARAPGRHRANGRIGGRHAGARLCDRGGRPRSCRRKRSAPACWRRPPSDISASTTRRSPARKADARRRSASRPRWARRCSRRRTTSTHQVVANAAEVVTAASPRHDVRSGRRVRADPVHRALRVRRRQVVDRLHDRKQRDPGEPPRRFRHDG